MQHRLGKDAEGKELIPDAVVFVKDKIIPVNTSPLPAVAIPGFPVELK